MSTIKISRISVDDGSNIFYRSAGPIDAPVILLLHGFPTSSHQFRNLIPLLTSTNRYRVVAPDLPGFGFTDVPEGYKYTFGNIAHTIGAFLDKLSIEKFAMYIFDYGAPTGLRLALERPHAVTALISQNGNAYVEGLGPAWAPIQQYWKTGLDSDRNTIRQNVLTLETTKWQYTHGESDPESIPPETYTLDWALLNRPGNVEVQLDLFKDYQNNVEMYPQFQKWLVDSQTQVLAVWGKNDLFFIPEGAESFKRDVKDAEIHLLDAGHFVGETKTKEIAGLMLEFLGRNNKI
ncbi:MAG: hypothetical protein M1834_001477 [Cirrosporium novae-zelandiae]|nr:MAG: hypothetical protein M1834_008617 [Cirrosporium novae-zelandiae]KAI9736011.1 MAG: hypothetical protein M1834_001477 [Cirrosporium novae-zelandiae]